MTPTDSIEQNFLGIEEHLVECLKNAADRINYDVYKLGWKYSPSLYFGTLGPEESAISKDIKSSFSDACLLYVRLLCMNADARGILKTKNAIAKHKENRSDTENLVSRIERASVTSKSTALFPKATLKRNYRNYYR